MKRVGLALSGGGFRATLFHLGLVKFLRDAGILSRVSHVTSVSGGSIIAAHLVLNWNRYNGSPDEFEAAASELLDFVRLDVRNRIVRRFPLALPIRVARFLTGQSNRRLTRPGLLEYHYERYLYGDISLFELPEEPSLHLLATNLSEGRLCSFNRTGLWMMGGGGRGLRLDRVPMSLATVPMAVAASSAFPGFFPPMVLTGTDVGAKGGEFGRQAYTDGGVFDNLGVRMFHWLRQALGATDATQAPWDCVVVSDAGRPFEIQSGLRSGGMIRTAMRASDILMDRVWQLETETFRDTTGFVFARITEIIDPDEDPNALHPQVQRQLPNIRTDLDRFSDTEISNLMQHGYCVGRKTSQARPDVFSTELVVVSSKSPTLERRSTGAAVAHATPVLLSPAEPAGVTLAYPAPATPEESPISNALLKIRDWAHATTSAARSVTGIPPRREATPVTQRARTLHASAGRRIWSTMLDYRDWVSYVYVPILVPILILTPYFALKYYERSNRIGQLIESLAQESRDLEQMTRLVDGTPAPFVGDKPEPLASYHQADLTGFTILQDLRIIDLRQWNPGNAGNDPDSYVYGYRRLKVRKDVGLERGDFRVSVLATSPDTQVRFPPQQLKPKLYSINSSDPAERGHLKKFEVGANFQKIPMGETVDVVYEHESAGLFLRSGVETTSLSFDIEAETIELSRWLLLPEGRGFRTFELVRFPIGMPQAVVTVEPVSVFQAADYSILSFKLLALSAGYTYELTWSYRSD